MAPATATLDAPVDAELDPAAEQARRDEEAAQARFDALNPCEVCGSHQHEGPEGTSWHGRHEDALHCWKCGYRPGQVVAPGVAFSPGMDERSAARILGQFKTDVVSSILDEFRKAGMLPAADVSAAADAAVARAIAPPPGVDPSVLEAARQAAAEEAARQVAERGGGR